MGTLIVSSFTLVYKLKRLNRLSRGQVFALVSYFNSCHVISNLSLGYTISRAILSDAIALTRGDRFYTSDYTPFNMTAWGFADCQRQPNGAGFGSTLGRLFLRTLPNDYSANSVYTWFPLMTPDSMKTHLTKLKLINKYSIPRPGTTVSPRIINDYNEIARILQDSSGFQPPYAAKAATVITGKG
jgi:linoleate 10R-lipoxygenase